MLRSLYSGVSGLRNHQQKMDVIGNNVANVNTVGFKKARASFKDMLSQTLQDASSPIPTEGGTNPVQIGLGVTIGSIENIMTQGSAQSTGKNTDLMLQGDGFFVLKTGDQTVFTRAGNFETDGQGNLVDLSSGAMVMAYPWDITQTAVDPTTAVAGPVQLIKGQPFPGTVAGGPGYVGTLESFSIDKTGSINGIYTDPTAGTTKVLTIAQLEIATFPNPSGLMKLGGNFWINTNNSGNPDLGIAGADGRGELIPGALEMSNVDLSEEFTEMIITQRGYQANSRVITVSDSLLEELTNLKRG